MFSYKSAIKGWGTRDKKTFDMVDDFEIEDKIAYIHDLPGIEGVMS